ncbi:hypothetical protein M9Y10_036842 [Tritrichomonas musculus]|uniref:Protein kinase domain-containing protein n=1 Tax=Tritrichomonas musculus TaxID=1915356 RepID=A0ABR2GUR8_9EUKA
MDLEIEIENNLRVQINQKDGTSSITKSPKATGNIIVPCFATYNNKQFKIISVEGFAFCSCNIESLIFPEDSKVETLKNSCFYAAHVKKIKFPPSLKKLDEYWASSLYDLVEIEISPKNPFFIYYDNKYLLGKSAESSGKFDVLYYARFDIDEALMPPQVTIIKPYSFGRHKMLKCVTFPNNSQIKRIENYAFCGSSIKKLELPASLEMIGDSCFNAVSELTEIKVSPKNKVFKVFDEKCLLMMSQPGSGVFDVLIFGMRDIESVRIPSYIKIINNDAFDNCEKLKSITFESGSLLEKIGGYGFRSIRGQEKMIIPPFVKEIGTHSFSDIKDVKIIEFLSKSIKIGNSSFSFCKNLTFISFPNADQITFEYGSMSSTPENMKIFVRREAQLDGSGLKDCMNKITYIEEKVKTSNDTDNDESKNSVDDAQEKAADDESKDSVDDAQEKAADDESKDSVDDAQEKAADDESKDSVDDAQEKAADDESKDPVDDAQEKAADDEPKEENHKSLNTLKASDNNEVDQCINNENENNNLKKFVGYLIAHLSKYETVISYDEFVNKTAKGTNKEELNYEHHSFVGADDEEFHRVVGKIGEGATSEVYKVIDERTGEVICKKVVKDCGDENAFKTLKNSLKELEVGMNAHHPCICEALGYNTNEALPGTAQEDQEEKTTIALFFELLPFSIESVIKKGLMSNTLKVRIAVEVAFGMSYLHSHGMMHRDLKLGNIMMNGVFNSKIIDFGLVHISDLSMSGNSMTKGIGTLAYMSPEMVNEEDYDNKTDVYSYGVVLFKLFAERLPKQSMRDRLNNVPMEYPTESGKISKYCINLIKRCTMFEPEQRPTFDEIIEDMLSNNFALASEVDVKVISQRFKELNNFRELNNERNNS